MNEKKRWSLPTSRNWTPSGSADRPKRTAYELVGRLDASSPDHQGVTVVARRAGHRAPACGESQGHLGHRRCDQIRPSPSSPIARAEGALSSPSTTTRTSERRGRWEARRDTRRRSSARSPRPSTAGRSHRRGVRRPHRARYRRTVPPREVARRGSRRSPSRRRATRTYRRYRAPPTPPGSRRCRPWVDRPVRATNSGPRRSTR